jgi:hypothetical protein
MKSEYGIWKWDLVSRLSCNFEAHRPLISVTVYLIPAVMHNQRIFSEFWALGSGNV